MSCFSMGRGRGRVCRMQNKVYAQGIFSLANLAKWFTWPWYGAPLPCQKNNHCNAWLLSSSSLNPNTSFLSANFRRYKSSADVSMTGKGGDWVWSMRMGMRPLGSRRRNQSFFCSFVMMLLARTHFSQSRFHWIVEGHSGRMKILREQLT